MARTHKRRKEKAAAEAAEIRPLAETAEINALAEAAEIQAQAEAAEFKTLEKALATRFPTENEQARKRDELYAVCRDYLAYLDKERDTEDKKTIVRGWMGSLLTGRTDYTLAPNEVNTGHYHTQIGTAATSAEQLAAFTLRFKRTAPTIAAHRTHVAIRTLRVIAEIIGSFILIGLPFLINDIRGTKGVRFFSSAVKPLENAAKKAIISAPRPGANGA